MENQVQSVPISCFVLSQKSVIFEAAHPASRSIQYFSELLVKWSREYVAYVDVALH